MDRLHKIRNQAQRRKFRVRAKVNGTSDRPRLSVNISHLHVSAQIINDEEQTTLASATTVGQKGLPNNLSAKAEWVGKEIAKRAKSAKVKQVVFDRSSRLYHGRVKVLADAAREAGLEL